MSATKLPAMLPMTMFAVAQPAPKTNVVPLDHALKARAVASDRLARGAAATLATMQLAARGIDAGTILELAEMQDAVRARCKALSEGWVKGWEAWAQYADQLKGANTMSKFVERECNILAQAMALMMKQVTDISGLQENIEVDYAYWVSEKLAEKRQAALF